MRTIFYHIFRSMKYLVNNGFNFSFKTMVMDNQKNTLVRYSCIHVILFLYTFHSLKMSLVNINPVYKYICMYITLLNLIYGIHVNYIPYDSFLLILVDEFSAYICKRCGGGGGNLAVLNGTGHAMITQHGACRTI